MTLKVLKAGIAYSVVGRLMKTQEGQLFEESPWDISTTKIFQARGYVETVLEAAAPKVEVVARVRELSGTVDTEFVAGNGTTSIQTRRDFHSINAIKVDGVANENFTTT